eukprot:767391-Amorphochlora_amoeboformis.AAC.1
MDRTCQAVSSGSPQRVRIPGRKQRKRKEREKRKNEREKDRRETDSGHRERESERLGGRGKRREGRVYAKIACIGVGLVPCLSV